MTAMLSKRTLVDYDPDKETTAADLNAQAKKLIEAGLLSETAYRSCVTLADLHKVVQAVTSPAYNPRTLAEILHDADDAETEATRRADRPL